MEIYKDIIGYEGIYKISNFGNIKSFRCNKEKVLKPYKNPSGYIVALLTLNGIAKTRTVHQLVAEVFLNHTRCGMELVINHIDFNKTNNNVNNLEIVTNRENSNRKHIKSSSQYTGVSWHKRDKKWMAYIVINRKLIHLGYFINELEASEAYKKKLSKL